MVRSGIVQLGTDYTWDDRIPYTMLGRMIRGLNDIAEVILRGVFICWVVWMTHQEAVRLELL